MKGLILIRLVIQEPKFIESRKTRWIWDRSFQAENSLFTRNITSSHKDEIKNKYGEIEHLHANL